MDRQDVKPYVGKRVKAYLEEDVYLLGYLALHRIEDKVCLGYNDVVLPYVCTSFPDGSVDIRGIKKIQEPTQEEVEAMMQALVAQSADIEPIDRCTWKNRIDEKGNFIEPFKKDNWFTAQDQMATSNNIWNTMCPNCGEPAYQGIGKIECSKRCM